MSGQTTLGDEDLFGEAAEEMRNEVETHLDDARAALPEADAVWDTDAANILGVLNGFKSALDIEDAVSHLRQAKKTFVIGREADAFDDAESLESAVAEVQGIVELLEEADELAGELSRTVPQLRDQLEDEEEES
ncbi:MAG: hypothetical protein J07HQX50_00829 [Haloquadratum sp. J07HQX50]|jgi:hypothetical protein|nr:MAG: hypothetical protein J07HQX50_00829 [Haloquadratum sp. J07HQX50]